MQRSVEFEYTKYVCPTENEDGGATNFHVGQIDHPYRRHVRMRPGMDDTFLVCNNVTKKRLIRMVIICNFKRSFIAITEQCRLCVIMQISIMSF